MGMQIGGGGHRPGTQVIVDINTTPLIDVMLVLLIMMIITIPAQLHSVNLQMPVGTPPAPTPPPEVVKLDIDERSVVRWNGEPLGERALLERRLSDAAAQAEQPQVQLRPDRRARYEVVASVMASAQRLGLRKIGIAGAEQFAE
jgi:biopolymer transport protein ExbD